MCVVESSDRGNSSHARRSAQTDRRRRRARSVAVVSCRQHVVATRTCVVDLVVCIASKGDVIVITELCLKGKIQ